MAKSKYESNVKPFLHLIPNWRKKGMTEEELCKRLGISIQTKENYKVKYIEFFEAIKRGREELVGELESALYKRAKGYDIEEVHTEVEETPLGKKIKKKIVKKHIPADVGALIFSLTNLDKENWKNNKYVNAEDTGKEVKDDGLTKQIKKIAKSDIWEGFEDDTE